MDDLFFTHDPIEMIAGTSNTISSIYRETVQLFEEKSSTMISPMEKNFLTNIIKDIGALIPKVSSDNSDINSSKGDFESYKHHSVVMDCIKYLKSTNINIPDLKYIESLVSSLKSYRSEYMEGYSKNIDLVKLEYESALYLIIEGLSYILSNNISVSVDDSNHIQITAKKSSFKSKNIMSKSLKDLSNQLKSSSHKSYLDGLLSMNEGMIKTESLMQEDVITEGAGSATVLMVKKVLSIIDNIAHYAPKFIKSIKQSVKVLPIIRSIVYMHYYKKAKKIQAIEQEIAFINLNINRLENKSNMDPKEKADIIAKQKRYIQAYEKKAEKLRAEFAEAETVVEKKSSENNRVINNDKNSNDDDFVLESFE